MTERCDLCGARFPPTENVCPECGTTRPAAAEPLRDPESATQPCAAEQTPLERPAPPPLSRETTPKRRPGLLVGFAAAVVVATGIGAFAMLGDEGDVDQGEAKAGCAELEALAGTWAFSTEVTGARSDQKLGLRGYYRLDVQREGCTATANLVKTGFGNRKFSEEQLQRGEQSLSPGSGAFTFGHGATFELRDASDHGLDQEFVFRADGDRLYGTWRQRGEMWEKSRLHGYLEGSRDAEPRKLELSLDDQPCEIKCAVACNAAEHDDAAPPAGLEPCTAACLLSGEANVGCATAADEDRSG